MSGTSLDGLDLVCATFEKKDEWEFKILKANTYSYSAKWKNTLAKLYYQTPNKIREIEHEYVHLLARNILDFTNDFYDIDFVSSHGHTIFHKPDQGITLQIGNTANLSTLINLPVICDFRTQDVTLGGQGAPLVPVGDLHLFKSYSACLNLGGFANVSKIGQKNIIAYDICALNTVLNKLAGEKGLEYDPQGSLAKSGKKIPKLFKALESLDYYTKKFPKSLGIEWVSQEIFPIFERFNDEALEDRIHTYNHHVGKQIGKIFSKNDKVLLSGGGTNNIFLISLLRLYSDANFIIPNSEIIDFKEALIFAFLGILRFQKKINCLSSVTGSSRDHCSGKIFYPEK